MHPSLSSSTTTPTRGENGCNEERLHHRRRRADSAPFTASKRQKTDDNDARRDGRETARAPTSSFFVRLARYVPILNRFFVVEEDVDTNVDLNDVGADAGDDNMDEAESSVWETCEQIRTTTESIGEEGEGGDRDGGEVGGRAEGNVLNKLLPVDAEKNKVQKKEHEQEHEHEQEQQQQQMIRLRTRWTCRSRR